MIPTPFRFGITIEIILVATEAIFPGTHGLLPLGGNHLAQIGVCLGAPFVVLELVEIGKEVARKFRRWREHQQKRTRPFLTGVGWLALAILLTFAAGILALDMENTGSWLSDGKAVAKETFEDTAPSSSVKITH